MTIINSNEEKPVIRYTMGKVSSAGWEILTESVRLNKKIYPEFDIVICHNKLNNAEIEKLNKLEVNLIKQDEILPSFDFEDTDEGRIRNFCWKLIPARIRKNAHELWVDNDIIFRGRIEGIDKWLKSNTSIISTGFNHDYGCFIKKLQYKEAFCAGLFGLPPHFDFESEIKKQCEGIKLKGFDEQGLVSLIVTDFEDYMVLRQDEVRMLGEGWKIKGIKFFPNGLHFARANRFADHNSWKYYKLVVNP